MSAVVSYSNTVQGVESDGLRSVETTIDFDTGTYTAGGIPIPLGPLGLRTVNKAYIVCSAHVDNQYTQALWTTGQSTVTAAAFVTLASPASPEAPRLVIFVAAAESSGAVAASRQFRVRLVGT